MHLTLRSGGRCIPPFAFLPWIPPLPTCLSAPRAPSTSPSSSAGAAAMLVPVLVSLLLLLLLLLLVLRLLLIRCLCPFFFCCCGCCWSGACVPSSSAAAAAAGPGAGAASAGAGAAAAVASSAAGAAVANAVAGASQTGPVPSWRPTHPGLQEVRAHCRDRGDEHRDVPFHVFHALAVPGCRQQDASALALGLGRRVHLALAEPRGVLALLERQVMPCRAAVPRPPAGGSYPTRRRRRCGLFALPPLILAHVLLEGRVTACHFFP